MTFHSRSVRSPFRTSLGLLIAATALLGGLHSARAVDSEDAASSYADAVLTAEPVAYWRFEDVADNSVPNRAASDGSLAGVAEGGVSFELPGPQGSEFPFFDQSHNAATFAGTSGELIRVADPGENSPLDFAQGDSITIEAWVDLHSLAEGQQVYIAGKGRTNNDGFPRENQNYSLRLRGMGGTARISFLFRSTPTEKKKSGDFHRWNSLLGFAPRSGWHHVAIAYTFGKPESITAYLDGRVIGGDWDVGGPTKQAPVVDDDEFWIGTSLGARGGNTIHGSIDELAMYRRIVPIDEMRVRLPEPPTVDVAEVDAEGQVLVEIIEGVPVQSSWDFAIPDPTEAFAQPTFCFSELPQRYNNKGLRTDRSNPFVVRASGDIEFPEGPFRLLLRARSGTRVFIDDAPILEAPFFKIANSGHGKVHYNSVVEGEIIRPLRTGDTEQVIELSDLGGQHHVRMEFVVGGKNRRPEMGETLLAVSPQSQGDQFTVIGPETSFPLTEAGWLEHKNQLEQRLRSVNSERRRAAAADEIEYWNRRHDYAADVIEGSTGPEVPLADSHESIHNDIDRFVNRHLAASEIEPQDLIDDEAFLRRVAIDVTGTIPTARQIAEFYADEPEGRRQRYIDRMLDESGWADNWVGYWQDVLAENPNIVNPTLNNTGPFRWWIEESFRDNKPIDRFVHELVMMEGSSRYGGPAGFEMASGNDVPMAAKAHILGTAFLGVNMKCARCHDAPFHSFKQGDLFGMAAMLKRKAEKVPASSSVPVAEGEEEHLLVTLTLKPGDAVDPHWSFEDLNKGALPNDLLRNPHDPREQLATRITSPHNVRFPQVIVNRLWARLLGRGLVDPVDDWEMADHAHGDLLAWLARDFVANGYDLKHTARLILNSHTYQRATPTGELADTSDYIGPVRRRMTAEQLLDSMFAAVGKQFDTEPMALDVDGARSPSQSLHLGQPERAWHFASPSNERDRPGLALPYIQNYVTLLETFGWRSSRQDPTTQRDDQDSVLQPGILANGVVTRTVVRLSEESAFTDLACEDVSLDEFIDQMFLRVLSRKPDEIEREMFGEVLADGFETRRVEFNPADVHIDRITPSLLSWSNHLHPDATQINYDRQEQAMQGPAPTIRLNDDWRQRCEDALWTLINTPEFLFVP